jgi:hypothetical protein
MFDEKTGIQRSPDTIPLEPFRLVVDSESSLQKPMDSDAMQQFDVTNTYVNTIYFYIQYMYIHCVHLYIY